MIRSSETQRDELIPALRGIGLEFAKTIIEQSYLQPNHIVTPMGVGLDVVVPQMPTAVVITTKDDAKHFGKGVAAGLERVMDSCVGVRFGNE